MTNKIKIETPGKQLKKKSSKNWIEQIQLSWLQHILRMDTRRQVERIPEDSKTKEGEVGQKEHWTIKSK